MPTPGFDRFAELEGAAVLPKTKRPSKGRRSNARKRLRLSPNYTTTLLPIDAFSNVEEEEELPAIENVDDIEDEELPVVENVDDIEEEEAVPTIEDFSDVEEEKCGRDGCETTEVAQRTSWPLFVELPSTAPGLFAPRLPDPITIRRRRASRAEEKMRTRRCSLDNDVRMFRLRRADDRQLSLTLGVLCDCDQRQAVFGVCAVACELVGVHEERADVKVGDRVTFLARTDLYYMVSLKRRVLKNGDIIKVYTPCPITVSADGERKILLAAPFVEIP